MAPPYAPGDRLKDYAIEERSGQGLTLRYSTRVQTVVATLLAIVGGCVALVGLLASSMVATGIGAALLGVGVLVRPELMDAARAIRFDTRARRIVVASGGSPTERVSRPASEVLSVATALHQGGSSDGSERVWVLELRWRDGAFWGLARGKKAKLDALGSELERWLEGARSEPSAAADSGETPHAFQVARDGSSVVITWRARRTAGQLVGGLLTLGGCAAALGTSSALIGQLAAVVLAALGLAMAVDFATHTRRGRKVVVGRDRVEYWTTGLFGKRRLSLPNAEVRRVLVFHAPWTSQRSIELLDDSAVETVARYGRGDVGWHDISAMFRLHQERRITAYDLSFVERLQLESLLQQAIEEQSGERMF